MLWLKKACAFILGCVYALLAFALLVLFAPALLALLVLFLSLCVFNVTFFKHLAVWCFNASLSTVTLLLGKASASFHNSEHMTE